MSGDPAPSSEDLQQLLAFRTGLRQFLKRSDGQARAAGVTPQQHQLLLAIRGHGHPDGPTVRQAAAYLLVSHNAAVQLADRAQAAGLIERARDPGNYRVVRLRLTTTGAARLRALSTLHLQELAVLGTATPVLWSQASHADPTTV